jgi:hypothetical protein
LVEPGFLLATGPGLPTVSHLASRALPMQREKLCDPSKELPEVKKLAFQRSLSGKKLFVKKTARILRDRTLSLV